MRLLALTLMVTLLAALVRAWEKLDHEIFELYDDIKRNEATSDWYELLQIAPKSSADEISRAYRQLSKKYHPDKLRLLPQAQGTQAAKRFQRMSLVVNILRDSGMRKRYDFFRRNGVPVWRGTGYLYRRWRPGFGAVCVGLVVFVSAMQYLFQALSFWRARQRIRDIEEHERSAGARLKVRSEDATRRQQARQMRRRQKKAGQAEPPNGADLDDSGIEGDDMDRFQVNTVGVINPYAVRPPSISRVLVVSLPVSVFSAALRMVGLRPSPAAQPEDRADEPDEDLGSTHSQAVADALENLNTNEGFGGSEAKAKTIAERQAKKAAKIEARRRRLPVV
ncbi:hypothetical protein IWW50_003488 [Coemansia erecta]|nr:hypothetical protein GGF43_002804 [Coemansia sp. RSA 2618]KAJ2824113.1 hypothetical protein IWW50_003488 [Coemansia erecta]